MNSANSTSSYLARRFVLPNGYEIAYQSRAEVEFFIRMRAQLDSRAIDPNPTQMCV